MMLLTLVVVCCCDDKGNFIGHEDGDGDGI